MHFETSLLETEILADADAVQPWPHDEPHHAFTPDTAQPEHSATEVPGWIWGAMIGSYITFFIAIFLATGGERGAKFAIIVSVLYTTMYFGTAKLLLNVGRSDVRPFTSMPGSTLQTWTGPMSQGAVAGQMLIVPVMIGLFAVAIAIIRAFVG